MSKPLLNCPSDLLLKKGHARWGACRIPGSLAHCLYQKTQGYVRFLSRDCCSAPIPRTPPLMLRNPLNEAQTNGRMSVLVPLCVAQFMAADGAVAKIKLA